jgi:paraquat-inducible protein B
MSKQANPTAIGGFVLGALALLVIALLLFGGGALFRERVQMKTFFPGSIQGLNVGAAVQFEGVTVGRVTGIELNFLPDVGRFRVPVSYEVWPDSVQMMGQVSEDSPKQILRDLVNQRGLHARLESLSFVTGQYAIALQLVPDRAGEFLTDSGDVVEVPALEATRDRVTEMLENLRLDDLVNEAALTLASMRQLIGSGEVVRLLETLNATLDEARVLIGDLDREVHPLAARLDSTLSEYADLANALRTGFLPLAQNLEAATTALAGLVQSLDDQVVPVSGATQAALDEVEETMRQLRLLADDTSGTRLRVDQFLNEATSAARALRSFADQIDRHPEALLRGRR